MFAVGFVDLPNGPDRHACESRAEIVTPTRTRSPPPVSSLHSRLDLMLGHPGSTIPRKTNRPPVGILVTTTKNPGTPVVEKWGCGRYWVPGLEKYGTFRIFTSIYSQFLMAWRVLSFWHPSSRPLVPVINVNCTTVHSKIGYQAETVVHVERSHAVENPAVCRSSTL